MLAFLDQVTENVVGIKVNGKFTHTDYQQLAGRLEAIIRKHGKVSLFIELEDCRSLEIGAAWDDLKFSLKHHGDFVRCAVVGNKQWQKCVTELSRLFFEVRYFDKSQFEEAWDWVASGPVLVGQAQQELGARFPRRDMDEQR
jgi:universal stress protein A